jgi:hypothetical protein
MVLSSPVKQRVKNVSDTQVALRHARKCDTSPTSDVTMSVRHHHRCLYYYSIDFAMGTAIFPKIDFFTFWECDL